MGDGYGEGFEKVDGNIMIEKIPLFSILVPVYNVEKYLKECIESVLKQTYTNYEVILINDGSTDNSGKICNDYAEKYSQIRVYHQENRGLMLARKQGILKARGKYCLFLDSDDYYAETLLEQVEKYIRRDTPDLLIFNRYTAYKNRICVNSFGKAKYEVIEKEKALLYFLGSDQYTSIFTKAVLRERILPHLEEIYVPVNYAEDALQTAYFILLSNRVAVLNQCLYYYRIREGSLIHQKTPQKLEEILYVKEKIYYLVQKTGYGTVKNEKSYFGNVLNDFMDGIFRINNMGLSIQKKITNLQRLRANAFLRQILDNYEKKKISNRNKLRIRLFKNKQYRLLILIDGVLIRIKRMTEQINKKQRFE